jgi:hypothetical protein
MSQTTVQRSGAIKLGSAKVEVGDDVGSLKNLGAMRGVTLSESWDKIEVESDNAGTVKEYIKNQRVAITGNLMEIDLEILDEIRGGIDDYSTTENSKVEDHDQTVASGAWAFDEFILLEHQNADGTVPQIDTQGYPDVSGSVDGALAHGTDYFIVKNGEGKWGIIVIDSATVTTEAQVLTISYDYTPAASKNLSSGGLKTINPKVVRLTNTDENDKKLQVTVYYAFVEEGITLEFPSDEAEDVMISPINLVGKVDVDRTAGDQLYEIIDEQSTT